MTYLHFGSFAEMMDMAQRTSDRELLGANGYKTYYREYPLAPGRSLRWYVDRPDEVHLYVENSHIVKFTADSIEFRTGKI